MNKWLEKYSNGDIVQQNYNDVSVSLPEGFVGMGYNTKGRNYSPAWGGQFEDGGSLPIAQKGITLRPIVINSKLNRAEKDSAILYNMGIAAQKQYKLNPNITTKQLSDIYDTPEANAAYVRLTKLNKKFPDQKQMGKPVPITDYNGMRNPVFIPFGYTKPVGTSKPKPEQEYPLVNKNIYKPKLKPGRITVPQMVTDEVDLPITQTRFPKGDYDYIFGPANSVIGRNYNGKFYSEDMPNQRGKVNQPDLDLLNNQEALKKYVQNKGLKFAMGGSLPGAVGFTYARTNDPAPSNGKYAKKTMPSAQDGWVTKAANAEFSCAANPRSNLRQSYSEYCNPKKGLDKDEYKALKNELSSSSMKDLLNVEEYYVLKNLADNQNRKMGREDNAYSKYFDQSTGLPIPNLTNELKEEGNLRATNRMYPGRKNLLVNDVYQGVLKDYNITTPQTPAQTKSLLEKAYNIGYATPKQEDGGLLNQYQDGGEEPLTKSSADWYKQWYEQRKTLPQFNRVAGERLKLLSTLPKVQLTPLEELQKFGAVGEYIKDRGGDASQDIISLADPATIPAYAEKIGKSIDVNVGTDPSVVGHEMSHWFDARAKQYMFKPRNSKSEPYETYPAINPSKFKKAGLDFKTYNWISGDDNPEVATGVKTEVNSVLNELRQKEGFRGDQSTTPEQLQKIIDKYMNLSEDDLRKSSPKGNQNQRIRTLIKYMGEDAKKLSELNNRIVAIEKEDVPIAKHGGWLNKFDEGGVTGDPNKPYDVNTNPEGYFYTSSGLKVHGKSKIQQAEEKKQVQAIKKYAANIPQTTVKNTINPNIKFNFPIANDSNSDLARKNELLGKFTTQSINQNQATIANFKKDNPWAANLSDNEVLNRLQMTQSAFQNQGTIKKAGPEEGILSRAWNIASNPMTALKYVIHKQEIPEHFERGEKNILDHAVNIINPATYINSGASLVNAAVHPWETTKTLSKAGVNLLTNFTDNTNVFNDESNSEALELLGDVGNMFMLGETGAFKPLQKVYNEVATGNSFIPKAWKSQAVGLSQEASQKMFNSLVNSGKLTDAERALIVEYQHNSRPFTGRDMSVNLEKQQALNNIINKYNLNVGENTVLTRRFNPDNNSLGATFENGRLNFGDRPTSFSAGVGIEGYGSGANNRLVIPNKYAKRMGNNLLANQYSKLSEEALSLLPEEARGFSSWLGELSPSISAEREVLGTGLDFKKIGKVKNDIGGYDYIVKPSKQIPKQLPGSPNIVSSVDDVGKEFKINNENFYRSIDLDDAVNSGVIRSKQSGEYAKSNPYFVEGKDFDKLSSTGSGASGGKPKYIFETPMVDETGTSLRANPTNATAEYSPYIANKSSIPISEGKIYKLNDKGEYELFNSTSSVDDVVKQPWQMQELPGLHLKSTMEGEAISKIVEPKTGLVNTEQALAIIGKESGGAEKVALIKQALGENVPKKMDYNDFRKTVQDQLIPLERQFSEQSSHYGLGKIGYPEINRIQIKNLSKYTEEKIERLTNELKSNNYIPVSWDTNNQWRQRLQTDLDDSIKQLNKSKEDFAKLPIENQTIILGNKNKFGKGSNAHGNPDETLGHIHFLRDAETPDVLTVTQIQSDAFQGTNRTMPKNLEEANAKLNKLKDYVNYTYKTFGNSPADLQTFKNVINKAKESLSLEEESFKNFSQKFLLDKNHQERYIQELVNYAGERGDLSKIRLPTSETAAKIQNYEYKSADEITTRLKEMKEVNPDRYDKVYNEQKQFFDDIFSGKLKGTYDPEAKTILKKYSEQPKLIKKLYGVEPKIVTDSKGNSWYEFDIPKSFKKGKGEIKAFKEGGIIDSDRGQWDHPGKITRIKGGNITMKPDPKTGKALNKPLLGISNTGETKMMYPGQDYQFEDDTEYVTEYPMAKNGVRQEQKGLQNLDDLLNFTNYNKPQPGGWLNKYN